ncbi:PQQ-binding-like beta-propeller repeat protein [Streptomyces sp. NPDC007264]|uniref:outer membrane protein assembly factor BamB family protein n=1 Tax=Streptomyces sp. NPDC007264 TaxID=3364777 RepID=UPI0036DDDABA
MYTQSALTADDQRRKRRLRLFGAGAAVLLVVVSAGGWLLLSDRGEDAPAGGRATAAAPDEIRQTVEKIPVSPEGQVVIDHSEEGLPKSSDPAPRYAPGTWATGKVFAKGIADTIVGLKIEPHYDEKAWTLKLDGHICATSDHVTVDGRTAVVVQPGRRKGTSAAGVCDEVVFFDLNTGKKLWQKKMPSADFAYVTNTNLTLTRGVVAVAWGRGSVAYDMKNGRQLWNGTTVSKCEDKGFAGGRVLLALESCGGSPDTTYEVQKLDPRTGRTEWTYKVAGGVQDVYLPSSDPPVLAVAAGDSLVTDLITLDRRGRHLATISVNGHYDPKCGDRYFGAGYFGEVEHCDGMVVGENQVYVASKETGEIDQPENWIMAFDRRTGKTVRKFDGRPMEPVVPLRMSGDRLLVYRQSYSDIEPSAVVTWDARTDQETPFLLFHLPDDEDGNLSDPERSDIVVEQGRVFFAKRELTADGKWHKAQAAIGLGSAGLAH